MNVTWEREIEREGESGREREGGREPSRATDLDGIMACEGWGFVARTAKVFVTVEEYRNASWGDLRRLPELP